MRLFPTLFLAVACGSDDAEDDVSCESVPTEASEVSRTLEYSDSCGRWAVTVGDQVLVNVRIDESESPCTGSTSGGVYLPYEPSYGNPSNEPPRWTFQLEASEEGAGELHVTCGDGSDWHGWFVIDAT